MAPKIISIEGNIGSGKSTLLNLLRSYYSNNTNVVFADEPLDVWNTITDKDGVTMLEKFYADQEKYSFQFQMMAYISRISELKKLVKNSTDDTIIITERSVYTDKNVFAKMLYDDGLIEEVEYKIYLKWFDEFVEDVRVDNIVYVMCNPATADNRVKKRSRTGENNIPIDYLTKVHNYHQEWLINSSECPITLLDGESDREKDIESYIDMLHVIDALVTKQNVSITSNTSISDNHI